MRVCKRKRGRGLVNSVINKLPIELHIPGYQYCGPGTKLQKRLARGDPGINPLDAACKEHDIAYSQNRENLSARHEADKILAERTWKRVFAKDASLSEKEAAWGIANTMKAKTSLGMGLMKKKRGRSLIKKKKQGRGINKRKKKTKKCGTGARKKKKISLRKIIRAAKSTMHPGVDAVKSVLKGAHKAVKEVGGRRKIVTPCILPVPAKIGGLLPFLIPLFAGLSATGALAGGAAGIAKAVNDASSAKRALDENCRHNETIEAIALGKGLYLKPYKKGLGLQLKN